MTSSRVSWAAALGLSLVFFLLALGTNASTSATWDEPFFLVQGLRWWVQHDYSMVRDSAPLPAVLGTTAVLSLHPEIPTQDPSYESGNHFVYARVLVNESVTNRALAPELFFRARLPISLVGALGVLLVFAWARRLSNDVGGVTAAALAAFSPCWIAHSSVFTTDVVASVTLGAAVAYASTLPARVELTLKPALALGALVFLALDAKFTALVLGPLLPLLAVSIALLRKRSGQPCVSVLELARLHARAAVVALALLALLAYPGEFGLAGYTKGLTLLHGGLDKEYRYFYCGSYSLTGWPTFAIASLVFKTPLGGLALLLVGTVVALGRVRAKPELLAPLLLVAAILGTSVIDPAAFGVRRVLPALPPLFVLAGVAVGALVEPARRTRLGGAGLGVALALLLANVVSCARAYPCFLPYANELIGGSERTWESFSDSNVDWGQALPDVRRELEQRGPRPAHVRILYFGRVDPALYGVHAEPVQDYEELVHPRRDTLYVCSVSRLHQARALVLEGKLPPEADWLTRRTPVARAGHAIFLYAIPERP